jgi:outer membrane beta-barrel protein
MLERAKALEPQKDVRIVQTRTVDRRHRVEFAPEFSNVFGGETYSHTKSIGMNVNYHFTPRFSVGLKYNYSFNSLTREGEAMVNAAETEFRANPQNPTVPYPQIDYVKDETLALFSWYPVYGKINLLDRSVVHFDIYALGGGGQVRLLSGPTTTYTAGGGIGFWFNPHLTARLEMRYQNYTAEFVDGKRPMDLTVGSVQMGWML